MGLGSERLKIGNLVPQGHVKSSGKGKGEVRVVRRFLEESRASVPPQLASHEASRTKPGTVDNRREKIQFAKK